MEAAIAVPLQVVVAEEGCLHALLSFVQMNLPDELPLPPRLAALAALAAHAEPGPGAARRSSFDPPSPAAAGAAAATAGGTAVATLAPGGGAVVAPHGFGSAAPLRAFELQLSGAAPPQLWVFVLPSIDEAGDGDGDGDGDGAGVGQEEEAAGGVAGAAEEAAAAAALSRSVAEARQELGGAAAALWEFVGARAPLPRAELAPALAAAAAALRAAALSEQQWLLASQASLLCAALRGGGGGGTGGGARLAATLERWASRRANGGALRARRGALLMYLAECERAAAQLSTQASPNPKP